MQVVSTNFYLYKSNFREVIIKGFMGPVFWNTVYTRSLVNGLNAYVLSTDGMWQAWGMARSFVFVLM